METLSIACIITGIVILIPLLWIRRQLQNGFELDRSIQWEISQEKLKQKMANPKKSHTKQQKP